VRLIFKISNDADGGLEGKMDSPDQGAKDIRFDSVAASNSKDGLSVRCEIKAIGGVFEGILKKDGSEIKGTWSQGGGSLPLVLKRVEKTAENKSPQDPQKPAGNRRPQDPQKPYPYDEEDVAYDNKAAPGVRLAGTLTIPRTAGPHAAVLLITGSGPQDRDEALMGHRPFLVLADHLTRHGIEVLRVDDRGTAKSTGDFSKATTEDFATDVLAGIEFLKGRKEVNHKQIGLVGHSEGGIIAPLVASKSSDVAFIVMMAGTSLTGEQIIYLQGALISKASGVSDEEIAKSRAGQEAIFNVMREEKDNTAAENKIRKLLAEEVAALSDEQRKALNPSGAAMQAQIKRFLSPWFRFFAVYDPKPALTKVKCPVLAINGEKDLQVPPGKNLPGIAEALEAGGNGDYEIVKLPNLNHLFQNSTSGSPAEYAKIDETIAPAALEIISSWIVRHVKNSF
jgi:pimeloyl-ACP methyl ester carboxylesterase